MKIELSNGYAEIKDFVSRKAKREYNNTLLKDAKRVNGETTTNPIAVEEATDVLVNLMLEKLVINDKEVPKSELENIDTNEFDKIANECAKLAMPDKDSKKK